MITICVNCQHGDDHIAVAGRRRCALVWCPCDSWEPIEVEGIPASPPAMHDHSVSIPYDVERKLLVWADETGSSLDALADRLLAGVREP